MIDFEIGRTYKFRNVLDDSYLNLIFKRETNNYFEFFDELYETIEFEKCDNQNILSQNGTFDLFELCQYFVPKKTFKQHMKENDESK